VKIRDIKALIYFLGIPLGYRVYPMVYPRNWAQENVFRVGYPPTFGTTNKNPIQKQNFYIKINA